MIPLYGLGIIFLLVALFLLSGTARNIRNALRLRHWLMAGAIAFGLSGLLLMSPRLAMTAVTGVIVARILLAFLRRLAPGSSGPGQNTTATPSGSSSVNTEWLHATLEHESGTMDAEIVKGQFTGQRLSELNITQLINLYSNLANAEAVDSMQIVEAFLDANHPDWREVDGAERSQPDPSSTALTRAKALEILGLDENADTQAIISAHRRLIRAVHPDRGGSSYLAAQLNQARDLLLGE